MRWRRKPEPEDDGLGPEGDRVHPEGWEVYERRTIMGPAETESGQPGRMVITESRAFDPIKIAYWLTREEMLTLLHEAGYVLRGHADGTATNYDDQHDQRGS